MFEVLLKEYCKNDPALNLIGDLCIDTACLPIPKVRFLSFGRPALPTLYTYRILSMGDVMALQDALSG